MDNVKITGLAISTSNTGKGTNTIKESFKLFTKMSKLYWLYLVFTNALYVVANFLLIKGSPQNRDSYFFSLKAAAKKQNIPIYSFSNFNDASFIDILNKNSVDLLLIRISSILNSNFFASIPKNMDIWCAHSSLLPAYKGIAGEFQAMRHQEKVFGTSIFRVAPKLDEGPILFQHEIPIDYSKTLFHNTIQNNKKASFLVAKAVQALQSGAHTSENLTERKASYYSWPKSKEVAEFHSQGLHLISWSEIFTCLRLLAAMSFSLFFKMHKHNR